MAISQMHEVVGNIHIHTPYSDGTGYHADIARAAAEADLDFIITTDHNVYVDGVDGYYTFDDKRVLVIVGEELHNPQQRPFGDHLLTFNVGQELAHKATDKQALIDAVNELGGLTFIAHPHDRALEKRGLLSYAWTDWGIQGITGIELWNYMSEFKEQLGSFVGAARATLSPDNFIKGPAPETLAKWDEMLSLDTPIVAIGGSDAHAIDVGLGPFKRSIFPYEYLFRCINTHILLNTPLSGDANDDKRRILEALQGGRAWIGYDLISPTNNFRFSAQGLNYTTVMGGQIKLNYGVTLQVGVSQLATIRLIYDGTVLIEEHGLANRSFIVNKPGVYRVEVYLDYKGAKRGWIFSNPIYVI